MQVVVRGSQGLYMLDGPPSFDGDAEGRSGFVRDVSPNCKVMAFSTDGSKFAWSDGREVKIAKWTPEGRWTVACALEATRRTTSLRFSPKGTVLCSWEVYAKSSSSKPSSDSPPAENNARLWDTESGRLVHGYVHRKAEGWFPQWTDDEKFCAHRSPNNEVVFFEENGFQNGPLPHRLSVKGLESFSVSPRAAGGGGGPLVACFLPGQKGGPGFGKLFAYPRFAAETDAVASRSFMTADKMEVKWCPTDGRSCLILAQSDVDKSGASYYGKTQLHFASDDGDTASVQLPKEGPIYSVAWRPSRPALFLVVYGFMPAKATLFNKKCDVVFDMGTGPRNVASFNPLGNLALVGGFGNLRGNIEVWDVEGKRRVSQFEAEDATDLKWCPDGQHILTSTCAPRLRTGNGFKVWHYTSTLFHETVLVDTKSNGEQQRAADKPEAIAAPTCDELWEVVWRPVPEGTFSHLFAVLDKPIAAGVAPKKPQASKQAYRPPGARGKPSTFNHRDDADGPSPSVTKASTYKPTRVPVGLCVMPEEKGELSKSAAKNKKRNKNKKGKTGEEQENGGLAAAPLRHAAEADDGGGAAKLKQVCKLEKKIADIEVLKQRLANGESLEANQLEKIKKQVEIIAQLEKLRV